jgi:hypothetical protein
MVDPDRRLAQLSRRRGREGAMICLIMETCKDVRQRLLGQGRLSCELLSILAAGLQYRYCTLQIFITQIMHGMRDQNLGYPCRFSSLVFIASYLHYKIRIQTVHKGSMRGQQTPSTSGVRSINILYQEYCS